MCACLCVCVRLALTVSTDWPLKSADRWGNRKSSDYYSGFPRICEDKIHDRNLKGATHLTHLQGSHLFFLCASLSVRRLLSIVSLCHQGEDGKPLYTQFDDNGVPTHDAAGEAIVKNKVGQEYDHGRVRKIPGVGWKTRSMSRSRLGTATFVL